MEKTIVISLFLILVSGNAFSQAGTIPAIERDAIIKTALDYGDGFYSGAPERMERAIHPDLNKVWVQVVPQIGKPMLSYSTFSMLVELCRAKAGLQEESARKIKVEVLRVKDDLASAKLTSARFNDYLQMVKIEGQWKIVNVLWTQGPDAPNRPSLPAFNPSNEMEPAKKAVLDFCAGFLAGDAARAESVLHPEVSRAVLSRMPSTGKFAIGRNRFSSLVEPLRAKLTVQPEDKRQVEVVVLDVMDGMAFVEARMATSANYFQLAWINGQWKIINILSKPNAVPQG